MYMKPGDICREYTQAKFKKQQIEILADQNSCTKEEIMKILVENGIELPTETKKKPSAKAKEEKAEEITQKEEKATEYAGGGSRCVDCTIGSDRGRNCGKAG